MKKETDRDWLASLKTNDIVIRYSEKGLPISSFRLTNADEKHLYYGWRCWARNDGTDKTDDDGSYISKPNTRDLSFAALRTLRNIEPDQFTDQQIISAASILWPNGLG